MHGGAALWPLAPGPGRRCRPPSRAEAQGRRPPAPRRRRSLAAVGSAPARARDGRRGTLQTDELGRQLDRSPGDRSRGRRCVPRGAALLLQMREAAQLSGSFAQCAHPTPHTGAAADNMLPLWHAWRPAPTRSAAAARSTSAPEAEAAALGNAAPTLPNPLPLARPWGAEPQAPNTHSCSSALVGRPTCATTHSRNFRHAVAVIGAPCHGPRLAHQRVLQRARSAARPLRTNHKHNCLDAAPASQRVWPHASLP